MKYNKEELKFVEKFVLRYRFYKKWRKFSEELKIGDKFLYPHDKSKNIGTVVSKYRNKDGYPGFDIEWKQIKYPTFIRKYQMEKGNEESLKTCDTYFGWKDLTIPLNKMAKVLYED